MKKDTEKLLNNKSKGLDNNGGQNFTRTDLGSATWVSLDGHSGSDGYISQNYSDDRKAESQFSTSGAPWGLEPSLEARCEEVGIDFDDFIEGLKNNKTDAELSSQFDVTETTISSLREFFVHNGIDTTVGQD